MSRRERLTSDSFLEALCIFRDLVFVFFVISLVFFLLSVVSYVVVEPGTAVHAILVLNMAALGVFIVVSGSVLYYCRDDYSNR